MPDPTFYAFDGSNLMHAGGFEFQGNLIDRLASFIAKNGVSGVVVFDGFGDERNIGNLQIKYAPHADDLIERIVAERRTKERVAVVSSDRAIEHATGVMVQHHSSTNFLSYLATEKLPFSDVTTRLRVEDSLDDETRKRLEHLRRRR